MPGQSGNPSGRPHGERELLRSLYGEDGSRVYSRLEQLRADPGTPTRLKLQIDIFVLERLFGKAAQHVDVGTETPLLELLAAAAARVGE